MLKITFLSFLLLTLFSCAFTEEKVVTYDDKYDYIDFDTVLANPRQRDIYFKCFMDLGPCSTADQKFFRDHIPDMFKTQCRRCTERQKAAVDKISFVYSTQFPEQWEAVVRKYIINPAGLGEPKERK